jgi:hypothetical protein
MTEGMTPERDDIRTDHWCAGLRLEESRPFSVAERTILERTIALHSRDLGLAIAGIPTTLLAALTILTLGPTQTSMLSILVRGAGILLAGIVTPAVLGLMIRDRWRERARFRADLDHGEMLCFSGQLDDGEVLDEEQKRLMAAGILSEEPGAGQWLDVLPVSCGVMVRRGREVRFEPVTLSEVASLPEYSWRVSVPREVAWLEGAPDAEIVRRTLNESERGELAEHIRHLRWPNHWVMVGILGMVAWAGILLVQPSATGDYLRRRWPLIALQVAALGAALFEYVRALRLAAQLARDAETGWAFMVERRPASETSSAIPRATEFLPHSRAVWNQQGKPARWRNLRRAA